MTDRFEQAVDRAVREMLDVEPPPGLRGRVLRRIQRRHAADSFFATLVASAFRRRFVLAAAAAVILIVALLVPRKTIVERGSGTSDAAPVAAAAPPVATERTSTTPEPVVRPPYVMSNKRRPAAGLRTVIAAVTGDDPNPHALAALTGPSSITVQQLTAPQPSELPSIIPAPMRIQALEVTPLSETPRERREE